MEDENAELVVMYIAYCIGPRNFFGILDGAVAELPLTTVRPDPNGFFEVEIPDFAANASPSSSDPPAALHLLLRDSKTWNHIAHGLEPEATEFRTETHELRIQSTYPPYMRFLPSPGWNL
jgi:hypothetical protein